MTASCAPTATFKARVASRDTTNYRLVKPGQFAYSPIHIDEGSIARNNLGFAGVVSPMYVVFEPSQEDRLRPRFLELLLRSPTMLASYASRASGTVHRRRSVPWKTFSKIELNLPDPAEQDRVIDLVDAAAELADSVAARAHAADALLQALLGELIERTVGYQMVLLGSLAHVRSGISWQKTDEVAPPPADAVATMGVGNVQRGGIRLAGRTYLRADKIADNQRLLADTILMIRTNGNPDRIGNLHVIPDEAVGSAFSSFLISIRPHDAVQLRFIWRVLQSPQIQAEITRMTTGSTGLKNVAVSRVRDLQIPDAPDELRTELVELLDAADEARAELNERAGAAAILVKSLTAELVTGAHEIPEGYDHVMNGGAELVAA